MLRAEAEVSYSCDGDMKNMGGCEMDKKKRYVGTNRPVRMPGFAQDSTPHERKKGPDFNMILRQKLVSKNGRLFQYKFGLYQKTRKWGNRQISKNKPEKS